MGSCRLRGFVVDQRCGWDVTRPLRARPKALLRHADGALTLLLLAISPPANAEECRGGAHTTVAIEDCQRAALAVANASLDATYRAALASLPPHGRDELRRRQRAWIRERDAACRTPPGGGSAGPISAAQCLLALTRARADALAAVAR